MADIHTKSQRSKNMAAIRGRYNKSTELAMVKLLRSAKITGWRRHIRTLPGTPDFVFPKHKITIFIDGCFWHGCKKCYVRPETNKKFWEKKIADNQKRDKKVKRQLIKKDWKVLRFWEHDLKQRPEKILSKITFVREY